MFDILVKEVSTSKFDGSIDLAIRLGVDPRKANQMVRGIVSLPNGTGKSIRVLALVTPDKEAEAKPAPPAPKKPMAEEAEADVTPELLEDVETSEATLVEATPEVDEVESTRASISNWLETNVLNKKS